MTTLTINRAEVFTAAWIMVNKARAQGIIKTVADLRCKLSYELRVAWSNAKNAAYRAYAAATQTDAQQAREAARMIENKDRLSDADRAEMDRLQALALEAEAEQAADFAEKRELIASAKSRFCSVVFIKADGTERTMQVQPAALKKHIKGDAATDAGKQAVQTRKARHPNLLPVWDVKAQGVRSINLATVQTITLDGLAHAYEIAA